MKEQEDVGQDKSFVDSLLAAGFPKKHAKLLPESFIAENPDQWDMDKIKVKAYEYQAAIDVTEGEMESNMEIASLKEKLKDLSSPYTDIIKMHKAMIKYLLFIGYGRGKI